MRTLAALTVVVALLVGCSAGDKDVAVRGVVTMYAPGRDCGSPQVDWVSRATVTLRDGSGSVLAQLVSGKARLSLTANSATGTTFCLEQANYAGKIPRADFYTAEVTGVDDQALRVRDQPRTPPLSYSRLAARGFRWDLPVAYPGG
jgi:hypothetical protein